MASIPDTNELRRIAGASAFGIPLQSERDKITAAADEIDALRAAVRAMLGPDTADVVERRSQTQVLQGRELAAIRRAFIQGDDG